MSNHKAKHTPGPWTDNVGPTHPHHVIRADGEIIAYTVDHTGTSAGNARLIAAAPELLEALKGLVTICLHEKATKDDMRMIASEARHVILAAEGVV